jgi:ribosome maturation factor RimP
LSKVIQMTEEAVSPILADMNLELVDIEFVKEGKNWFLRVFIDSNDGVDIEECGKVSEKLSEKLDSVDPIEHPYFLEVSSPGAERPLKNQTDIKNAIGKQVNVKTYEPIEGEKVFEGKLTSFDGKELSIDVKIKNKVKTFTIPYEKVAKARLAVVF